MKTILEGSNESKDPISLITDLIGNQVVKKKLLGDANTAHYLGGSISNYVKDLIMSFPMLIDNSLSPELCSMLSKANERNIASMLHMLFSAMQINGNDGREIIKQIHGNEKLKFEPSDYIDMIDMFVNHLDKVGAFKDSAEMKRRNSDIEKAINECVKSGKAFGTSFDEVNSINERSLSNFMVTKDRNDEVVVREIKDPVTGQDEEDEPKDKFIQKDRDYLQSNLSDPRDIADYNTTEFRRWQMKQDEERREREAKSGGWDSYRNYQTNLDVMHRGMLDSDVKKANELQPTLLVVNYNELDGNGNLGGKRSFICGVKSRLIPIEPNDIIERIVSKNRTKLSFLNFIRATTKEIKFFRDFLFCLDQAKADARNSVKKGEAAAIWKTLEVMSTKNKYNRLRKRGNDASAITTLVVSKETANLMKKQFKIDIEQPKTANGLLDQYNLLALFIVDESVEVVKILYRGNQMFEQQAFSYLEREENDKSYKKIINLIGQMNR